MNVEAEKRLAWLEDMVDCYENTLTGEEREHLHSWESEHVLGDGESGRSSDWPGWERHIGRSPIP